MDIRDVLEEIDKKLTATKGEGGKMKITNIQLTEQKIKMYRKLREDLGNIITPMLHVCTQSGASIVAVYEFYAEVFDTDMCAISAAHSGSRNWQLLGMYHTKERMLQIYEEMLQHSKANPVEVYQMPKE